MTKSTQPITLKGRPFSEQITLFLACGFGSGLLRPAPGTWGTLPGVLIAWLVMSQPWLHIAVLLMVSVLGVWLCDRASVILGVHDHGGIVIDEIAGVLITLLFFTPTWLTLVLGFLWFRLFDIVKPPPIKWADERVHNGLGIMLDDWIAGAFAWVGLWLSLWLGHATGVLG
ncbi:MAG: phosphatidylglycerophosphatase A [Gammaproteobacteria bacterium]|nr:MAG: phosphatidylglycerophosphatase A [Gammaproteobacteria bacterium]